MATDKKTIRSRNYMYTQQIAHLPNNMTIDDLFRHIDSTLHPKKWAGILHDHDLKDDNKTPADNHVHVMLQFDNSRSVNQVAKDIGDQAQYLQVWNGRINNGFAYLVHATKEARHKHQYSCDEVKANFDYSALINRLVKKASKVEGMASANQINGLLDMVGSGQMTLKEAKNQMSGSVYAKASTKLERAHALYLEKRADELHRSMEENNELVSVHWFYGSTETGKTFLAKKLASEIGDYYLTSTTQDAFQYYQAEPVIILDELRPGSIPYSELLELCNPFSRGKTIMSSRYHNKPLACRAIFITSPYSPFAFVKAYNLPFEDRGDQLYRRLSSILHFEDNHIVEWVFDNAKNYYTEGRVKPNPYSRRNQQPYQLQSLFDEI